MKLLYSTSQVDGDNKYNTSSLIQIQVPAVLQTFTNLFLQCKCNYEYIWKAENALILLWKLCMNLEDL